MKRSSGIIMHLTSLPGPYGIGSMGEQAKTFIRFLRRAGQDWWQVLPLGPTGFGNSPYQPYSTFAGNPILIDLQLLLEEGLLKKTELAAHTYGENPAHVDYEAVQASRSILLRKAFQRRGRHHKKEMKAFATKENGWVADYALFMALKEENDGRPFQMWPEQERLRMPEAMERARKRLDEDIEYWIFVQFLFDRQWKNLKLYANANGVQIIGDIPISVSSDSSDVWANSLIFRLDEYHNPEVVSGCPPDNFSEIGQLWGTPVYDWDYQEETGYKWWIERIRHHREQFDKIRMDHFRGFESYWAIPGGEATAINGKWVKGPGIKLFKAVEEALGKVDIIAEDLGFLTSAVHAFREESGFPSMKVLQFAFSGSERSSYLPYVYQRHCVVYTGTHDNDTVMGWMHNAPQEDMQLATQYLALTHEEGLNWGFIRGAWSSTADLAIAQMQDFLDLGSEARMNIPSTIGPRNWSWRMLPEALTLEIADRIEHMTSIYGRGKTHDYP